VLVASGALRFWPIAEVGLRYSSDSAPLADRAMGLPF
jgi:hypothetical protein